MERIKSIARANLVNFYDEEESLCCRRGRILKDEKWWEGPTDEELEKEYLSLLAERCSSYTAFAGSYD